MQESNPLVLEIFRQADALKMGIFEQREAVSTLRHYSLCRVSFEEIQRLCQEVTVILSKSSNKSSARAELIRNLVKTAQVLWDYILAKKVKDRLKTSQISDLIISIDEELINIPWELLHDGNNFLCLNFNIGRLVRTREESSQVQYRSFPGILRMLILANPTNDLRLAYLEGVQIKNQFDRKRESVHIDFKSTSIDKLYVKKNLSDYDIVHFAGHCEYEPQNPQDSGWVLSDARLTVQDILGMGSTASLPSLVFSNACYSANSNPDTMEVGFQEKNYNLASAFLFSGVRHYIGAIRRIEDPVSLDFSKEFYAQLINGASVGESLRHARLKLIREHGIGSIYWAGYLLYGDPNFVLFKGKKKSSGPKKKGVLFFHRRIVHVFTGMAGVALLIWLLFLLPTINPGTYARFLNLERSFYNGNNNLTISLAQGIIKKEPSFLAAYPLLADTYQRLGDRENALKYYFDYARISERKSDKKRIAEAYIKIGWFYQLEKEYTTAFNFYNKALLIAQKGADKLHEAEALRKLAVWYIDKKDYVQALELLTKSSEINRERGYLVEHRYALACDYFDMGLLFTDKDDFLTAKGFYQKSLRLFEKLKVKSELSDCYFNLGEVYLYEKEFQKALDCYLAGLRIDQGQGNKMNLGSDYNMFGELYVEMDNYTAADEYFNRAISCAKEINDRVELAAAYHNLGLLYKKKGQKSKVREYLRQAQEIYYAIDPEAYQEIKKELFDLSAGG